MSELPDGILICPKCGQYIAAEDDGPQVGDSCFDLDCCGGFDEGPFLVSYRKEEYT